MKSKSKARLLVEVCGNLISCVKCFPRNFYNFYTKKLPEAVKTQIIHGYRCESCGCYISKDYTYSGQVSWSCPNNCGFQVYPDELKKKYSGYPEALGGVES